VSGAGAIVLSGMVRFSDAAFAAELGTVAAFVRLPRLLVLLVSATVHSLSPYVDCAGVRWR
jgi:hypothetical protein